MSNEAIAAPVRQRVITFATWQLATPIAAAAVIAASVLLLRQHAVTVDLVQPAVEDMESTVSATGTVTPIEDFPARAAFAGIVDKIDVRLGEHVHPGQQLVDLRDQYAASRVANARAALQSAELTDQNLRKNGSREDRITAASELERAEAEQQSAAKALATVRQLRQIGSASDAEVNAAAEREQSAEDALHAAQQKAQSRYRPEDMNSAKAKIAADKATLAAERVSYANAHIASPIDGTVYLISAKHYDFVQMGADLVHVADLTKLGVRANFFEPDIRQLSVGQSVRISWTGAPGRTWLGEIRSKPMAVTGEGVLRTGECTIAITSDTRDLPVNTGVTVSAVVQRHPHAITLAREAVRTEGDRHYVFLLNGDHLRKVPVEVGLVTAAKIEIIKGLSPDDRVATRAAEDEMLKDNLRVAPAGQN